MNYLDIILIILLGLAAFHGFRKGFIIELATLVALVLGVLAGFYFSDFVSGLIEKSFDYHGKYINIISFIVIFIAVIVLVQILARIIEKAVKLVALGFLNKLCGAVFSVLKVAVILSIIIYFMNRFDEDKSFIKTETRQNSFLFPIVEGIAPVIIPKMKEYTSQIQLMPNQAKPDKQ
jgi:membrane protein required for colicin V production